MIQEKIQKRTVDLLDLGFPFPDVQVEQGKKAFRKRKVYFLCKAVVRNIIAVNKIFPAVSDVGLKHILRHKKLSLVLDLLFKNETIGLDKG